MPLALRLTEVLGHARFGLRTDCLRPLVLGSSERRAADEARARGDSGMSFDLRRKPLRDWRTWQVVSTLSEIRAVDEARLSEDSDETVGPRRKPLRDGRALQIVLSFNARRRASKRDLSLGQARGARS